MSRPIIKCKQCNTDQPHAAAGMCSMCYKNSKNRRMEGAYSQGKVERSATGRPLCRWCKKEVPRKRRTFCGEACIHEWSMRTSPQYVRAKVLERDHGICAICGLDVPKMEEDLYALSWEERATRWAKMQSEGWACNRNSGLWEADHIKAVVEGGGMHGLENYRTLCVPCHKKETALLRKRMAVAKRRGVTLETVDSLPCTCSCVAGSTCLDCICHWRHEGPAQISESKQPASYWEGKGVQSAPGHTDLMISPEAIDAVLATDPPPPPAPSAPAPPRAPEEAPEKPPTQAEQRRRLMAASALLADLFK